MLNIILDLCIFLTSLIVSIYVAKSKNIYIIASIEQDKVKPENVDKISYIFSVCLFMGTTFIVAADVVYNYSPVLSIASFILGMLVLVLFYVLFVIIEKK